MTQTTKYLLEGQESERLHFRQLTENDFDRWLPFCEDAASLKYMGLPNDLNSGEDICRFWFDKAFKSYNEGLGGLNV